jgi:hypothetical protein
MRHNEGSREIYEKDYFSRAAGVGVLRLDRHRARLAN